MTREKAPLAGNPVLARRPAWIPFRNRNGCWRGWGCLGEDRGLAERLGPFLLGGLGRQRDVLDDLRVVFLKTCPSPPSAVPPSWMIDAPAWSTPPLTFDMSSLFKRSARPVSAPRVSWRNCVQEGGSDGRPFLRGHWISRCRVVGDHMSRRGRVPGGGDGGRLRPPNCQD